MDPGAVIAGRFQIESLAGEGGMSIVYRAVDRLTGDHVAFKVLRDIEGIDPDRFVREALVLAELSHPAIVRHLAHGTLDGRPYLAMEWLTGEDLDQRLSRQGLTTTESVTLARRVCEGLAAAQARGVVHRDIKPANIFLPGGDVARAKVLDFGIARRLGAHAATRTGAVLGTPGYMAPEQVRGERVIDARVDVFSLGCVLFECLTGRAAFEGDTPISILARILIEDAPRASSVRGNIPPALDGLVARMVARRKEERPPDAAAVIEALDALGPVVDEVMTAAPARPAALTHGERRLVCVIAASTASDDVFPADDVAASQGRTLASSPPEVAVARLSDVAVACGGHLEVLGGTLLVVFSGDGVARDLAARAARCALAFVREGVSAVALVTGRAELHDGWPVGEAVDRAFGLVEASRAAGDEPDRVALDAMTASLLAGSFEVEQSDMRPFIKAYGEMSSIDRSNLERSAPRALLGREVPCVGRERELATLDALLGQTIAEETATAVLITGPAGIGKTRLVTEFLARARARYGEDGVAVWGVRGDPVGAGAPFGLIAPMLRNAAGVLAAKDLSAARERVRKRFGPALASRLPLHEAASALAWVAELAGVPFDDADAPELTAARSDPQWMGDAMLAAWVELVGAESHARPLLVVFDNAHWGDPVSMRFVEQALKRHADRPWMALAVARDELHDAFPRLWDSVGAQQVRVGGIARKSAERLCRAALGDGADPALVARLIDHANGSPLFLEELLRESGRASGALPESVVAMVQARVEAMEPEARRVLRAASVFGQVFWRGGVAALLGGRAATPHATVADVGSLDEWLDELARREVIERVARPRFPGEVEWAFRHDLLRMAAYAMLTGRDRDLGHALAGAWLRASNEPNPLVLADHFARGGCSVDAAQSLLDAARQALEGHDLGAALQHTSAGFTHCARARNDADDPGPIDRTEGLLRLVEADAHLWRGEPLQTIPAADEAMRLLPEGSAEWFRAAGVAGTARGRVGRIRELAEWVERTSAVTPTPGALSHWAIAFARVAVHLYYEGDFETPDRVLAAVERAIAGRDLGPLVEARIAGAKAARASVAGDLGLIEAETLRALRAYERAGDLRDAATQRTVLGIAALRSGRHEEAETWLDPALAMARRMGFPLSVGMVLRPLAQLYSRRGEHERALAAINESIAHLGGTDHHELNYIARCERGMLLFDQGDLDAADAEARAVLDAITRAPAAREFALALRSRVALAQGRVDEALELARAALASNEHDNTIIDSESLAVLAEIEALVAHGDTDRARDAARTARSRLLAAADQLSDPERRGRYLERVPLHAALMGHAARLDALP